MSLLRPITPADIKGPALYGPIRDDYRRRMIELKAPRRVIVGKVSLSFENRQTLTMQIEEMLRTENITSPAGIAEEIAVYNALMPDADSLSATLFIAVGRDTARAELDELIGLDEHVVLHIGGEALRAQFEPGRSTPERISAVQYLRFKLSTTARVALATAGTRLELEIDHPNYAHRVELPEATRASLAHDFE